VGCPSRESFSAYLNLKREARLDYICAAMGWLGGRIEAGPGGIKVVKAGQVG